MQVNTLSEQLLFSTVRITTMKVHPLAWGLDSSSVTSTSRPTWGNCSWSRTSTY